MECEDTCRCYADYDTPYPHNEQTCGTRKKGYIIPCKSKCCAGGCPNNDNYILLMPSIFKSIFGTTYMY